MEKYKIKFENNDTPKYAQVAQHIKGLIEGNIIKDGEKLPPIREMASMLNINRITIVNAYKKLESEGYAVQKIGSGTYAKKKEIVLNFRKRYGDLIKKSLDDKSIEYIDFTGESISSELFHIDIFKNIIDEVLERDGVKALVNQEALGYEGLRKTIDDFFWDGNIGSGNILIVSGAQQGIDIVSKALINVNDNVVVEKPTYGGALTVFKWRRANIFEVPIENDGMDLDLLEKLAKKNKIKCVYIMSYFQNPTGISYSLEKKKRLLNMAEIYDFYIIEDDYLSELIYNNMEYKSFKSMDINDRVIYIKSFSKVFLPGIRLGYLISPKIFKENIQNSKVSTDIATSSLMQRVLELYVYNGFWKGYITDLNKFYKQKYDIIAKYLKIKLYNKVEVIYPNGGLYFYIKILSDGIDSIKLFYKCREKALLITPGVLFYLNPEEGKRYFRIGFSQVKDEDIKKGIDILDTLL